MIVRIDGYKHVSKKETGEVRTIIYCSVPAVSDRSEFGFIPVSAVWLNDLVSYDCGKFYEAVIDSYLWNGKLQNKIIGFDPVPEQV